jgi:hypothetical protein
MSKPYSSSVIGSLKHAKCCRLVLAPYTKPLMRDASDFISSGGKPVSKEYLLRHITIMDISSLKNRGKSQPSQDPGSHTYVLEMVPVREARPGRLVRRTAVPLVIAVTATPGGTAHPRRHGAEVRTPRATLQVGTEEAQAFHRREAVAQLQRTAGGGGGGGEGQSVAPYQWQRGRGANMASMGGPTRAPERGGDAPRRSAALRPPSVTTFVTRSRVTQVLLAVNRAAWIDGRRAGQARRLRTGHDLDAEHRPHAVL